MPFICLYSVSASKKLHFDNIVTIQYITTIFVHTTTPHSGMALGTLKKCIDCVQLIFIKQLLRLRLRLLRLLKLFQCGLSLVMRNLHLDNAMLAFIT